MNQKLGLAKSFDFYENISGREALLGQGPSPLCERHNQVDEDKKDTFSLDLQTFTNI